VEDPIALDKLRADALAAGVRLHVLVDARDGLLDGERIRALVPDWQQASLWFCGPTPFGHSLFGDFIRRGLSRSVLHQELFHMR
jgi:predicted ferric reductase